MVTFRLAAAAALALLHAPPPSLAAEPAKVSSASRPLPFATYDLRQDGAGTRVVVTSPTTRTTLTIPGVAEGRLRGVNHPALVISGRVVEVMATTAGGDRADASAVERQIASETAWVEKVVGSAVQVTKRPVGATKPPRAVIWELGLPERAPSDRGVPITTRLNLSASSGDQVLGVSIALEKGDATAKWAPLLEKVLASVRTEPLQFDAGSLPSRCAEVPGTAPAIGPTRYFDACGEQVPLGCICLAAGLLRREDPPSAQLAADVLSFACDRDDPLACGTLARLASDQAVAARLRKKACSLGVTADCAQ